MTKPKKDTKKAKPKNRVKCICGKDYANASTLKKHQKTCKKFLEQYDGVKPVQPQTVHEIYADKYGKNTEAERTRKNAKEQQESFEKAALSQMELGGREEGYKEERPPDYYEKKQNCIMWLLRGHNIKDACALAGISKATFYKWKKNFVDFVDDLKKAMLLHKSVRINHITKAAAMGNWTASAWYLERMYSSEFSMKHIIETQAQSTDPTVVTMQQMMVAALEKTGVNVQSFQEKHKKEEEETEDIPAYI